MKKEFLRMSHWLLFSIAFYVIAMMLAEHQMLREVQTVLWKMGHATIAAFIGYWIDRALFRDRICADSNPLLHIRRAIIVAVTMLAVGLGL